MEDIKIIMIHGLAAKPPKIDLLNFWKRALIFNLEQSFPALAKILALKEDIFEIAYWANVIPDHIEDGDEKIEKTRLAIENLLTLRKAHGDALHIDKTGWTVNQLKQLGLNIVDALSSALTIKDNVIHKQLREVRYYRDDQYIADKIRNVLEEKLMEAWDEDKRIILMSHSMGSFISYDVLWRFSYRPEHKYAKYRTKKVDMFITMGSPLGDASLRDFMLIERWKNTHKDLYKDQQTRFYPTNIQSWYNFSAYGDIVCHDATLEDDFFNDMRELLPNGRELDLKDYYKLFNPYIDPDGGSNPHKVYGYLVQPKLAKCLVEFFKAQQRSRAHEMEHSKQQKNITDYSHEFTEH